MMKIGVMSAAFPSLSFEQLLDFLSSNGFGSVEVACWPAGGGKDRKYGGVVHIDVDKLSPAKVDEIKGLSREKGVELSVLGYYPNALHDDPEHRRHVAEHLKKVILGAEKLGIGVVGTFTGRPAVLAGRSWTDTIDKHFEQYMKVWPDLVKFAGDHGVKIVIEHCPMLWHDTWPGGDNLSYSPAILRRTFEAVPDENYGILYDPSHFIWQGIDYIRFIYDFKDRIFCVHAQDMDLDEDKIYEHGILSAGIEVQQRRIPGMGRVDWQAVIRALYNIGYDWVMNIEHEDSNWEGSVEKVQAGFLLAKKHLENFTV